MKDYSRVLELLAEKKSLFLELERVSTDMPLYHVDELAKCMEQRGRIIQQIEQLDDELQILSAEEPALRQALHNVSDRGELSGELLAVYDASLGIKAVVNRLQKNDGAIKEHLEYEKQLITKRIEDLNNSSEKAADKYYRSIQTVTNRPIGLGKDRMI